MYNFSFMKRNSYLLFILLLIPKNNYFAQAIGGIINSYASVSAIAGNVITVNTTAGFSAGDKLMIIQMKGATVNGGNSQNFGNITSLNSAGMYEFKTITAIAGNQITLNSPLQNNYNVNAYVQIVRVPRYCIATVTSTITCPAWNGSVGGIIALQCGTLILNSDINANGCGFRGGNFTTGFFSCNTGIWAAGGTSGGEKGESISDWIANFNQCKANQANGGGGSNRGNSGGGGGGNGGAGGLGGNQWSGCGNAVDERGRGGLALTPVANRLFMGGGGGGGFRDNGQPCSSGGNGGGIIYIEAQTIVCNNRVICSEGQSASPVSINDEGAGGGGAGGSIYILCNNYIGNLTVRTNGGNGGSNFNVIFPANCHGPGGGGGGGVFGFSSPAIPAGITYLSNGGNAGTVNNPAGICFANNQTFGAQSGQSGTILPNLPSPQPVTQPQIQVTASSPSVCANSYNNSNYQVTFTVSGASTYSWYAFNNLTTSNLPTSSVITASATVTNGVGTASVLGYDQAGLCPDTATVSVNILPNPVVAASNAAYCSGQQTTLSATGANAYTWSPSQNLSSTTGASVIANPPQTTQYQVYGYDGNCYSDNVGVWVTVNPLPQIQISSITNTICSGNNLNLSASGAVNYTWLPNSFIDNNLASAVVVNPTSSITYTVIGELNTCTSSAVFHVSVIPVPTLLLSMSSTTICSGFFTNFFVNGAMNYQWSPSYALSSTTAGQVSANPTVTTVYQVIGSNGLCTSQAQLTVFVVPFPDNVASASLQKICLGMSTQLSATGGMHYHWQPHQSLNNPFIPNPIASPQTSTNYTITVSNSMGSHTCSSTKEIYVEVIPKAELIGKTSYSMCEGETIKFQLSGSQYYLWKPPISLSNPTISSPFCNAPSSMVYTVYGNNAGICQAEKIINLTVHPKPKVNAGLDTTYNLNEILMLYGSGQGTLSWKYDPDILCLPCPTTQVLSNNSKCYILEAINEFGCTNSDEVCITITKDYQLWIPNSFSPNGDGVNDVFFVKGNGLIEIDLMIFDRWGKLIFRTQEFNDAWDGKYNGEICKQDVYTYKLKVKVLDGTWVTKTGHITLLR
jgi:gliding motility-associated-like protein